MILSQIYTNYIYNYNDKTNTINIKQLWIKKGCIDIHHRYWTNAYYRRTYSKLGALFYNDEGM